MEERIHATPGHLVEVLYSSGVEIDGVTLRDSPFWTLHPYSCDGVHIHDVTIRADPVLLAYNTDGIDPDSCTNVLVERVDIATGDDAVAIKSGWDAPGQAFGRPSANITVRDSVLVAPKGACVAVGSEMSGGVYDVHVANVTCRGGTRYGLGVKTGPGRGGFVRNVTFEDITLTGGVWNTSALWLTAVWADHNPVGCNASDLPLVSGITFRNVSVAAGTGRVLGVAAAFQGDPRLPMRGVTVEDVVLPGASDWECNAGVSGSTAGRVTPPACTPQFQPASEQA